MRTKQNDCLVYRKQRHWYQNKFMPKATVLTATIVLILSMGILSLKKDAPHSAKSYTAEQILDLTDSVRYPEAKCQLHGIALQTDIVPIGYGLLMADPLINGKEFPYSNRWYPGGCIADVNRPVAKVYFCPKCRRAEIWWKVRSFIPCLLSNCAN
ncbi:MAG TPA: hypothetical protein VFD58_21055 [Blastocatellia bacterium]|nr:hypothetical protein [Blastocatellia bacterium]